MNEDIQYMYKVMAKSRRRYTVYMVLALIILALVAAVLGYVFISRTTPATIVMSDYLEQTDSSFVTGYNGAGVVNIGLKESVFQDQMDVIHFDSESSEAGKIYMDANPFLDKPSQIFSQLIPEENIFDVYPVSGLSNGDIVTIHWTFGGSADSVNELFSHLNFNIEYPDIEIVVSGLEETPVIISYDLIPDTVKEELQQKANEILYSDEVSAWDPSVQDVASVEFLGSDFQCSSDMSKNVIDELFLVTENVHGYENGQPVESQIQFYWYAQFSNATMLSDNSVYIDTSNYKIPKFTGTEFDMSTTEPKEGGVYRFGGEAVTVNGFESYEEMMEFLALE